MSKTHAAESSTQEQCLDEESTEPQTESRIRKLTPKAQEIYQRDIDKFKSELNTFNEKLNSCFIELATCSNDVVTLTSLQSSIDGNYEEYVRVHKQYCSYLANVRTEDSHEELSLRMDDFRAFRSKVSRGMEKIKETVSLLRGDAKSAKSVKSKQSGNSITTISSIRKAETAKARLKFAEEAASIKRQKALLEERAQIHAAETTRRKCDLDTDLELLKSKEELVTADIEADVNAKSQMSDDVKDGLLNDIPEVSDKDKTTQYVRNLKLNPDAPPFESRQTVDVQFQPTGFNFGSRLDSEGITQPARTVQPTYSCANMDTGSQFDSLGMMSEFTNFLKKKELATMRLTKFDDDPASYIVWKGSFKAAVAAFSATAQEELDLLLNHLGPESQKQAHSIRRANADKPSTGLSRVWDRLDERYGAPELVDSNLRGRISSFPHIVLPKDSAKLYELVDLLHEVEAVKENPRYSALFSYYDTSGGVNPVVAKLPYNLQNKWIDRAMKYKRESGLTFPKFSYFVEFIKNLSVSYNDPSFNFRSERTTGTGRSTTRESAKSGLSRPIVSKKTGVDDISARETVLWCPVHPNSATHTLDECKVFRKKSHEQKRQFLSQKNICYRCCRTDTHTKRKCKAQIKCLECGSTYHVTALHITKPKQDTPQASLDDMNKTNDDNNTDRSQTFPKFVSEDCDSGFHGGEQNNGVTSKCTSVCGKGFQGRSCAKIVLVKIYHKNNPDYVVPVYAMLDEHCNRTLVTSDLLEEFGINGEETTYTLSSCSGIFTTTGRQAYGFTVEAWDHSCKFDVPVLIECSNIPQDRSEIPTPEVARHFGHLEQIADRIPPYNPSYQIGLLVGRDILEAHHVYDQIVGPLHSPFAQRVCFGWVIIGDVCLDKKHQPEYDVDINISSFKTHVFPDGRTSIFKPCKSALTLYDDLEVASANSRCDDLFVKQKDDDEIGLSIEDRQFIRIMDKECERNDNGNWTVPLPFREPRVRMPNNKPLALKRAKILDNSLKKNPTKCEHFVTFMKKVFDSGAAEAAPDVCGDQEVWYLPIFGVYNAKKPDQIRGVFDSSAVYQGVSLNSVLLSGPNITNNLLGILLRFRKDAYAVSADIEQMFYSFFVRTDHRDFLRFLWYKNNDPTQELTEFRMCAHVFGNSPSPAVATYCLRKSVENSETDVREFVNQNFYVDDGLTSLPSAESVIKLVKRTQTALKDGGNIRLHKFASNSPEVMRAFPKEDLGKSLKSLNLEKDSLPMHQSLGMLWDLSTDCFTFRINFKDKPNTRRGFLSMLNSIYDPMGFVAPMLIEGKIIMREVTAVADWDDQLDPSVVRRWEDWKACVMSLEQLSFPRMFGADSLSLAQSAELHVFCDASVDAVAAVGYLKSTNGKDVDVAFVFGKTKVAPTHGHTVPRLELCAALLATEVSQVVLKNIGDELSSVKYYSDSKVVLGYIHNKTRRFYNYVSNRVERILRYSEPDQWMYIPTEENPADLGTRGVKNVQQLSRWTSGPESILREHSQSETFPLVAPDDDKEVRVISSKTIVAEELLSKFEKFSEWSRLVSAVTCLRKAIKRFKGTEFDSSGVSLRRDSETFLIRLSQRETFSEDLQCIRQGKPVSANSPIVSLSPYLDENDILRVGGRLNQSALPIEQRNPIIMSGKSFIVKLLVRHYHEQVNHQGRHFTEGALRTNGIWIVGAKRLISSVIHRCVICRRLRGGFETQKMSDLPIDRVSPGPPFSSVGVDAFGPWTIVTRRTRGGQANSKRWAIMFTCLTTRAIHIEVVESMSSSSFINAVRRLVALRGNVREFRSDRGSNFIGAVEDMKVDVQSGPVKTYLDKQGISWIFNVPHSSHMGGVWERMIGITRNILDSMLLGPKGRNLTHEVLVTLMSEVTAIVNSRPIAPVSYDPEFPLVLSPGMLINQRISGDPMNCVNVDIRDIYREQWKQVQVLADIFWDQWKDEYLQNLQHRRKWTDVKQNINIGDVVILKDRDVTRSQWPLGQIEEVYFSNDGLVRKVKVRVVVDDKCSSYIRPISELVKLF